MKHWSNTISFVLATTGAAVGLGNIWQFPALVSQGGLLFVVLPNACVSNSRYFDMDIFTALMKHLNFELVESKITRKLVFAIFRLEIPNVKREKFYFPRIKNVKGGKLRNNFSIILEKK